MLGDNDGPKLPVKIRQPPVQFFSQVSHSYNSGPSVSSICFTAPDSQDLRYIEIIAAPSRLLREASQKRLPLLASARDANETG